MADADMLCERLRDNPSLWTTEPAIQKAIRLQATATLIPLAQAAIEGLHFQPKTLWERLVPLILADFGTDDRIWFAFIESDETRRLIEPMLRLLDVAAHHVTNNRTFMTLAIASDLFCMPHLGPALRRDISFLLGLLTQNPRLLLLLPGSVFQEGPELLKQALPLLFRDEAFSALEASFLMKNLMNLIPNVDEFIHQIWIPSGGPLTPCVLNNLHPSNLVPRQVWERFTLSCERNDYLVASYSNAPLYMRSDCRWMMKRILDRPILFVTATTEVQRAIRRQSRTYALFRLRYGRVVEDAMQDDDDDFNTWIIATFLGSHKLREALEYERH